MMDFYSYTHNPHDLTQEWKQGGENGSRVGRMEAGWGEWKQGGENGSRVERIKQGGENESRVGRVKAGWRE